MKWARCIDSFGVRQRGAGNILYFSGRTWKEEEHMGDLKRFKVVTYKGVDLIQPIPCHVFLRSAQLRFYAH
jgi:hypothetical protein